MFSVTAHPCMQCHLSVDILFIPCCRARCASSNPGGGKQPLHWRSGWQRMCPNNAFQEEKFERLHTLQTGLTPSGAVISALRLARGGEPLLLPGIKLPPEVPDPPPIVISTLRGVKFLPPIWVICPAPGEALKDDDPLPEEGDPLPPGGDFLPEGETLLGVDDPLPEGPLLRPGGLTEDPLAKLSWAVLGGGGFGNDGVPVAATPVTLTLTLSLQGCCCPSAEEARRLVVFCWLAMVLWEK